MLGTGEAAAQTIADASLVLTELVTNAVNAGGEITTVSVAVHRDHLQVSVTDSAPGRPALQHPAPTDPHGRGLQIVDQVARSWGVVKSAAGKRVWAVLPVPARLTTSMDCTVSTLV